MLGLVALFGLAGILVLQFTQQEPPENPSERALVQGAGQQEAQQSEEDATAIQRIPGNLIRENEQPEAGRPFIFELGNFSQGAEYSLDLGDGKRKTFKDGKLHHTYYNPGTYEVTLYARYEGQELALQKVVKQVANTVTDSEITPIIDF
ncbi:MAG: PKD domain-containing protein [Saprospiraceae bacterium]